MSSSFGQRRVVKEGDASASAVAFKALGTNVTRLTEGQAAARRRLMGATPRVGDRRNTTVVRLNEAQLGAAPTVRVITNQERHAANHRQEEMRKLQGFLKKGFEQQVNGLLQSIRQSQEQIGKDLSDKFTSLQASMSLLNRNILAADENQRNNFIQLQHRVVEAEAKINEYRENIKELFKELNTNDEARFRAAKLKLEEYNALIEGLTSGLDTRIKGMELRLNGELNGLMTKLHNIDLAMDAGVQAATRELNLELLKIKDLILRETNPVKLRDLEDRARILDRENEDVEIYVCLICGSSLHGASCAAYSDTSVRRSYLIKRRQLNLLGSAVGVGRGDGSMSAYYVEVGRGGNIAGQFESLLRSKGLI